MKFFNIDESYSIDDDDLWGKEEAKARLYISFLYDNNGSKKVTLKGTVNKYNPLILDEDDYGDTYKFDSYLVKALRNFHYGYNSYSVTPIYPAGKTLYNPEVNIPGPYFNSNIGEVTFGTITTDAHIFNNDIPCPLPENDDALPDLLEFNDLNQNGRRDNGEKIVADYGGEDISEKVVSGTIGYDEKVQFPLLKSDIEIDGLLDLSSQQRLIKDTVQFAANITNEQQMDKIIAEIDNNNKKLVVSYNNN